MTLSISRFLHKLVLLLSISPLTTSRHVHRRPIHKHHVRQLVVPAVTAIEEPSTTTEVPASFTAGDAAIEDIQAIQDGLSDLPRDLLTFIQAIEHRMEELEVLFQSLIPGSPEAVSTSQSPSLLSAASSTGTLPIPDFTGLSIPLTGSYETTLNTATAPRASAVTSRSSQSFKWILSSNGSSPNPVCPYASGTGYPLHPASSTYTFDPQATGNIAINVYNSGRSPIQGGLSAICDKEEIDTVLLSFYTTLQGPEGYPSFGASGCTWDLPAAQKAAESNTSLCAGLVEGVTKCQQAGKKVLVGLQNYEVEDLPSDERATELANITWNLLGGGEIDSQLRPLGPGIKLDGFVMDGIKNTSEWLVFASSLRSHFDEDSSKSYYLASAPDCSLGNPSIGIGIMAQSDFVYPGFTGWGCGLWGLEFNEAKPAWQNSTVMSLEVSTFVDTLQQWSTLLIGQSTLPQPPRLYLGMSIPQDRYGPEDKLAMVFNEVQKRKISNWGGAMIRSGDSMVNNVDGRGNNYLRGLRVLLIVVLRAVGRVLGSSCVVPCIHRNASPS
ncbi:glycoside hydrolase family 18 protein [Zasmidium cellare ATCC 36951]|uniref:Glycoside hydrolase family 18 protein n=1 Tax=Zasmidium cellare ATCC 36951 TaxID=1080233 RepID=A0A6A6CPV8_ZASCE|nr:glycoside hydrolase family 18 protein [Zasmidium cellare ATCC 36951]KAF2169145.1 glycoside hydrolase family 18 protein [Zasmidium cellare ATCC 36951]